LTANYRGFNFDSVYDALKDVAVSIDTDTGDEEFAQVEAGKPDNISMWPGDTVLIALGKINEITSGMGGKGEVAHFYGYYIISVEGENEQSQRRAAYLWDRLYAAIKADRSIGFPKGKCKCTPMNKNPGGFRQNDKNMGSSKTPDPCAGAVLVLNIEKARELITL